MHTISREKRAEASRLRELAFNAHTEQERNAHLRRASQLEFDAQRFEAEEERVDAMSTILCSDRFSHTHDELARLDTPTLKRMAASAAEQTKPAPDLSWCKPMSELLRPDDAA